MKYKYIMLCSLLVSTVLSGCSSTGGTIGGLLPAPKFTKGELTDGIYTAKDKSFSVASPFDKDSYEYTYMAIAEKYGAIENSIQFSSSAAPAEVYRISIFKNTREDENLEQVALNGYRSQFENMYASPFQIEASQEVNVRDKSLVLNTFSQHIPRRGSLGKTVQAMDVLHSCLYFENGVNAAFACVNRIAPGKKGSSKDSEGRLIDFFKSIELN